MWSYHLVIYHLLLLSTVVRTQNISPSNSSDLNPATYYPRFNVSASGSQQFPGFQVAPLAQYAALSRQTFLSLRFDGNLIAISPADVKTVRTNDISYISCDEADYNTNIGAAQLLGLIGAMGVTNSVIFYTRTANHCDVSGFMSGQLPNTLRAIFTTLDPVVAGQVADMDLSRDANVSADISPDSTSYTDPSSPFYNASTPNTGPTTAVAMIVLYTITGIITALFISIIVTGAIRAHRHPERYGPRRGSGARGGQSRAKGIARAVLETIPIVKFGDQQKGTGNKEGGVEMVTPSPDNKESPINTITESSIETGGNPKSEPTASASASASNPDGSDEQGVLGCSICTEEFQNGEEVRVLPCNHKFHPDCVDPWLLNVSGTCPLCRIDLRGSMIEDVQSPVAHPLSSSANTGHMQALRSAFTGTREERIAALRRFRIERRNRGESTEAQNEEERRGLARRLTDRFRIRTRHHDVTETSV